MGPYVSVGYDIPVSLGHISTSYCSFFITKTNYLI